MPENAPNRTPEVGYPEQGYPTNETHWGEHNVHADSAREQIQQDKRDLAAEQLYNSEYATLHEAADGSNVFILSFNLSVDTIERLPAGTVEAFDVAGLTENAEVKLRAAFSNPETASDCLRRVEKATGRP